MKELPKSLEFERTIIGGLMSEPELIADMEAIVDAGDFASDLNRNLFGLIGKLYRENGHLDMVTICQYVADTDTSDLYGGYTYISSLPEECVTTANLHYYAKEIRERSIRRKLMTSAGKLQNLAEDNTLAIDELIERGQQDLLKLTGMQRTQQWFDGRELVETAQKRWIERQKRFNEGATSGIPTGLVELDRLLCGMESGLYLLAARPSMGKTALALNIALSVLQQNIPVGFFSLEMDNQQLMDRMAACLSGVDSANIRSGDLSNEEWSKLSENALDAMYNSPIMVSDKAGVSAIEIHAMSRRMKLKHDNLGLIVVDYLQLINPGKAESQEQGVSAISNAMKTMSRELDVPVLALSQLNRSCENRDSKKPKLSDLRGSGSLEQDADVVMFLFREAYYRESADENEAHLLIRKHRNGPTGNLQLHWNKHLQRFSDWVQPMRRTHTDEEFSSPMERWGE